jgi:membrane protein
MVVPLSRGYAAIYCGGIAAQILTWAFGEASLAAVRCGKPRRAPYTFLPRKVLNSAALVSIIDNVIWFRNFHWKAFARNLYDKMLETDVFGRAAQVAFYFSFAFFPLLLFLITLFGLVAVSTESLQSDLNQYLGQILPPEAFDLVRTTMDEIVQHSSGGKLTLGVLATLWSASAGVDSLRSTLNSVYEVDEDRAWWYTKLQSLIVTFMFILLLGIALAGLAAGWRMLETLFALLGYQINATWVLTVIQWIGLALVTIFTTAVVYSWLPNFEKFRWVWISPGAVVAILLWIVLTSAFRLYLQYFNTYNKAYGSLGAVIILMLWMYLTGMALLIGGAMNSVLSEMSEGPGVKKARQHEKERIIKEKRKEQRSRGA